MEENERRGKLGYVVEACAQKWDDVRIVYRPAGGRTDESLRRMPLIALPSDRQGLAALPRAWL